MNDPIEHTDLEVGCKYLLLGYNKNDTDYVVSYFGTFKKYIDNSKYIDYPTVSYPLVYSMFVDVFDNKIKNLINKCVYVVIIVLLKCLYTNISFLSLKELCWNMISDEDKDELKQNYNIL